MKFRLAGCVLAALAMATPTVAVLADGIEDAIKARRGYFQLVKFNAGALFGMAKGDIPYDAVQAQSYALNLQNLTQMNTMAMWPAGSSKDHRPGETRALQAAWDTWPAIGEKNDALKNAVAALAGSAGSGLDSLRADIGALGGACKGCHDNYRAKDF